MSVTSPRFVNAEASLIYDSEELFLKSKYMWPAHSCYVTVNHVSVIKKGKSIWIEIFILASYFQLFFLKANDVISLAVFCIFETFFIGMLYQIAYGT